MQLFVPCENRFHNGDADAAANIAHEIVKTASVTNRGRRQFTEHNRRKRNKNHSRGKSAEDNGNQQRPGADLQIDVSPEETADCKKAEASRDKNPRINLAHQNTDEWHGADGPDPP